MNYIYSIESADTVLSHHGIKNQKWGVRRYQNLDGSLTEEGRRHYGIGRRLSNRDAKKIAKTKDKLEKYKSLKSDNEKDYKKLRKEEDKLYNKYEKSDFNDSRSGDDFANKYYDVVDKSYELKNIDRKINHIQRKLNKQVDKLINRYSDHTLSNLKESSSAIVDANQNFKNRESNRVKYRKAFNTYYDYDPSFGIKGQKWGRKTI